MTSPVRPKVLKYIRLPEDYGQAPLRALVDWHMKYAEFIPYSDRENTAVTEAWVTWCEAVAKREGVPPGWLSYSLAQLVEQEMRIEQA